MRNKFLIIIMGILLLTAIGKTAHAHPHVFISQKIEIVFDEKGLAGFNMEWEFDDMFTSMILGDYDVNKNQILEKNEVATIKEKAFSYLSNSNYFTFIKIEGRTFDVKFVQNFYAKIRNKKLIYEFFVPCHVSAVKNVKHINVATYDPSYYSAIFFSQQDSVRLNSSQGDLKRFDVKTIVKEDKSTKIYFDMISPMALFLEFKTN
ncbi:MAG: DUF1007 family protein [Desulfobacteraceae bacterium]|nr:DUF1007 family protein [Desulfobacteraceae bacterium]